MARNIINEETITKEDGSQYLMQTIDTGKQIAVVETRLPTAEELAQQEYETERQKVINDVKTINDSILIGEATEADKQARLDAWAALKLEKGWTQ
jgi:hypothetical protein